MRGLALWLLLSAGLYAQTRYARVSELVGTVETRIHPSEPWRFALRNAPLVESSWIQTGPGAHAEIELDEGSVLRLGENSLCELADYTRLSTGQRITHISLDRGVAYFSGESSWRDALVLSIPSAQVSIRRGSRVRLEGGADSARVTALEGDARLSSAAVELDLTEGKMLKLDPTRPDKFYLYPEIAALDSDTWSLNRDKLLAGDRARNRLPGLFYGVRDLDANGEWIDTAEFGMAWKPAVATGWSPFREGKWQWYDGLGYTWIGAESWGWLPYHYGRWMLLPSQGWIWAPGTRRVFKPGDVYWMRGASLVGWGPLAPGESWSGVEAPTLYLKANTTFARYAPSADLREIDPAGFSAPPREPLATAAFYTSIPSPRISPERLDFVPEPERAGMIRLSPAPPPVERARPVEPERSRQVTQAVPLPPPPARRPTLDQPVAMVAPPEPFAPIVETYYTSPVWTGIVILNPPEKKPARPTRRPKPPDVTDPAGTDQ